MESGKKKEKHSSSFDFLLHHHHHETMVRFCGKLSSERDILSRELARQLEKFRAVWSTVNEVESTGEVID